MKLRTLESDTRMRFLLGSNPMGEMIKIVSKECKRIEKKKGYGKQIQNKGLIIGNFNCVFSSTIPTGSGLSSSAALECGFLFGLNEVFHLNIKPVDLALMGQSAEHWVGINCGIMDQFSSVMGKANQVIKIDCRTLDFEYHNADFSNYSLVLFDSNVKHSLFTSAYNQRREECEQGLAILSSHFPEVKSFREASEEQLLSIKDSMTEDVFKRSHYVIKEIKRVTLACEALDRGDILTFDLHRAVARPAGACARRNPSSDVLFLDGCPRRRFQRPSEWARFW